MFKWPTGKCLNEMAGASLDGSKYIVPATDEHRAGAKGETEIVSAHPLYRVGVRSNHSDY